MTMSMNGRPMNELQKAGRRVARNEHMRDLAGKTTRVTTRPRATSWDHFLSATSG